MKSILKKVSALVVSLTLVSGAVSASAMTTNSSNKYFNSVNGEITQAADENANITDKKEVERLISLGFTEDEIKTFSNSEYKRYDGLKGTVVNKESKYYKVTRNSIDEVTKSEAAKGVINTNVKNSLKGTNDIIMYSSGDDTESTSWLVMTTTVSDLGNKNFTFKNSFSWLTQPYFTYVDVIALSHASSISSNQGSEYLKYTFDRYQDYDEGDGDIGTYIDTKNVYYWTADVKNSSGYAFSYDLLHQDELMVVRYNRGYMVYTGTATPSSFTGYSNAFGHYMHQQITLSFGISLTSGNLSVSPSYAFDSATDTDVQFYIP